MKYTREQFLQVQSKSRWKAIGTMVRERRVSPEEAIKIQTEAILRKNRIQKSKRN